MNESSNGNVVALPYVTPASAPTPDVPLPTKLSKEDRLEIENLFLKVENLKLQQLQLQRDITTSVEMRQKLQGEMSLLQLALSKKYGVDLQYCDIGLDGSIVPKVRPQ